MRFASAGGATTALRNLIAQPATRQLLRYAVAGLGVTQFAALIYSALVSISGLAPLLANSISTAIGLVAGYLIHSRWSFAVGGSGGDGLQVGRFLIASFLAYMINSFWIWTLVHVMHLPPLAPVPLMMLVTPVMSFLLNRYWVFKAY